MAQFIIKKYKDGGGFTEEQKPKKAEERNKEEVATSNKASSTIQDQTTKTNTEAINQNDVAKVNVDDEIKLPDKPTFKWDGVGEFYQDEIIKRAVTGMYDHARSLGFSNKRTAGFANKVTDLINLMAAGKLIRGAGGEFIDLTGERSSTGTFKTNIFGTPKVDDNTSYNDAAYYLGQIISTSTSLSDLLEIKKAEAKSRNASSGIGIVDPNRGRIEQNKQNKDPVNNTSNVVGKTKGGKEYTTEDVKTLDDILNQNSIDYFIKPGHLLENTPSTFTFMGEDYNFNEIPNQEIASELKSYSQNFKSKFPTMVKDDLDFGEYHGSSVMDISSFLSNLSGSGAQYSLFKIMEDPSNPSENDKFILNKGFRNTDGNFTKSPDSGNIEGNLEKDEYGNWIFNTLDNEKIALGSFDNKTGSISPVKPMSALNPDNFQRVLDYIGVNPLRFNNSRVNQNTRETIRNFFENAKVSGLLKQSVKDPSVYILNAGTSDGNQTGILHFKDNGNGNISIARPGQSLEYIIKYNDLTFEPAKVEIEGDKDNQIKIETKKDGGKLILSAQSGNRISNTISDVTAEEIGPDEREIKTADGMVDYHDKGVYNVSLTGNQDYEDLGVEISDADRARLVTAITDIASLGLGFVPGANFASAAVGMGSSAANLVADISDENVSGWSAAGNALTNFGLDAVSLVPGLKTLKVAKVIRSTFPIIATVVAGASALGSKEERAKTLDSFKKLTSVDGIKSLTSDDFRRINSIGRAILLGKNYATTGDSKLAKKLKKATRTRHTGDQYEYTVDIKGADGTTKSQKVWVPKADVDANNIRTQTQLRQHAADQTGSDVRNIKLSGIEGRITPDSFSRVIPKSKAEYKRFNRFTPRYHDNTISKNFAEGTWLGGDKGIKWMNWASDKTISPYVNKMTSRVKERGKGTKDDEVEMRTDDQIARDTEKENTTIYQRAKKKAKDKVKNIFKKKDKVGDSTTSDTDATTTDTSTQQTGETTQANQTSESTTTKTQQTAKAKPSVEVTSKPSTETESKPKVEVKSESDTKSKTKPKTKTKSYTKDVKTRGSKIKNDSKKIETSEDVAKRNIKISQSDAKSAKAESSKSIDGKIKSLKEEYSTYKMPKNSSDKQIKDKIRPSIRKKVANIMNSSEIKKDSKITDNEMDVIIDSFTEKVVESSLSKIKQKNNIKNISKAKKKSTDVKKALTKSKTKPKSKPKTDKKELGGSIRKYAGGDQVYKTGFDYSLSDYGGINRSDLNNIFLSNIPSLLKNKSKASVFGSFNRMADLQDDWSKHTGNRINNPVYSYHPTTFKGIEQKYRFLNKDGDDIIRTQTTGRGNTESSDAFFDNLGGDRNNDLRRLITTDEEAKAFNEQSKKGDYGWSAMKILSDGDQHYRIMPTSDMDLMANLNKKGIDLDKITSIGINNYGINPNNLDPKSRTLYNDTFELDGDVNLGDKEEDNKDGSRVNPGVLGKLKGINVKPEDILELTRLGKGLAVNNRIAQIQKDGLKPLYINTPEHFSPVHGDFLSKQSAATSSANLRSMASKPRTADASLQLAGELEAGSKANAINYDASLRDAATFRETSMRDWTNRAKAHEARTDAANRNRSAGLQITKAKSDIESARRSANFSQVLTPFLANIENRLRQNRAMQKNFTLQQDVSKIQNRYNLSMNKDLMTYNNASLDEATRLAALERYKAASDKMNEELLGAKREHLKDKYLIFNKGGKITGADRIKIQEAKDFNKRLLEDQKTFYKILDNSMKENGRMIRSLSPLTSALIKDAMSV